MIQNIVRLFRCSIATRPFRTFWVVLMGAIASSLFASDIDIELKSGRTISTSTASTAEFQKLLLKTEGRVLYGLISFGSEPSPSTKIWLNWNGIALLSAVQGAGAVYRVRVSGERSVEQAIRRYPSIRIAPLGVHDRVSQELIQSYAGMKAVLLSFHRSVPENVQVPLAARLQSSVEVKVRRLNRSDWFGYASHADVMHFGSHSAVRWIEEACCENLKPPAGRNVVNQRPGSPDLAELRVPGVPPLEGRPKVAGSGVVVGLFDLGVGDHPDLRGRLIHYTAPKASYHGTYMAGLIAGDGTQASGVDSCGRRNLELAINHPSPPPLNSWRGVAPGAKIIDIHKGRWFGLNALSSPVLLNLISGYGLQVSNHSYAVAEERESGYTLNAAIRDEMIRGDSVHTYERVPARLQVVSAGNYDKEGTLAKQAKNQLIVGGWNTIARKHYGSRGPTVDGRAKPDVVAPAVLVWATSYCETPGCGAWRPGTIPALTCVPRRGFYGADSGTSVASALSTGVVALVLEQFRKPSVMVRRPDPLPSSVRAIMVHAARNPKDHSRTHWTSEYGWGLVDAEAAVGLARRINLTESKIKHRHVQDFRFMVSDGDLDTVRVVLAWDDPAADSAISATTPVLINDLDLLLIDPNGKRHHARNASTKVQRDSADRLNNLELVDAPAVVGEWRAIVIGHAVRTHDQRFSLVGARFQPARRQPRRPPQ